MTMRIKWTIVSIAAIALCGWIVQLSLRHAALTQQRETVSALRNAQLQTTTTWNELNQKVTKARERTHGEGYSLKSALGWLRELSLTRALFESFSMPSENHALYTMIDTNSGFVLLPDGESELVVFVRKLEPDTNRDRLFKDLQQTLESPDRRISLPVKSKLLTEYRFDTSGSEGALEFGLHLIDLDESRFIAMCDVNEPYQFSKGDGPYHNGVFQNHVHEVTYGWPPLTDLSFLQTLQKRRVWMIACNEVFRSANDPSEQSTPLHVVLVFASRNEWRIHPDYLYARSLDSGFDLTWDSQQANYRATPKTSN